MSTRARKRSSQSFIQFLFIVAAVVVYQLVLSCAEGGGTGLIEQYAADASTVVQDTGPPTPTGFCGDGVVNIEGEQCDGTDLDGMTCGQLGMGTGDLACYAASCVFDTSMCHEEEPAAGGAGGSYGGGGTAGGV